MPSISEEEITTMKPQAMVALAAVLAVAMAPRPAGAASPILQLTLSDRAQVTDHDNGIYVVGTYNGYLYVIDEAGSPPSITQLGLGPIRDVRIENSHVVVAVWRYVLKFSLTGLTPVEDWRIGLGWEVPSVDLSVDGALVASISAHYDPNTDEDSGLVSVIDASGAIVDSQILPGDTDPLFWLDATADMEYIAITDEPSPPGPEGEATGVELFRFNGTSLTRQWGTVLMDDYETTELRISEAKDYIAAATSSGTFMMFLRMSDGAVLWAHNTPGKEQFACDGDDNLNYVIGGNKNWSVPYAWFALKSAGSTYEVAAVGSMGGPITDLDSNSDASLLVFASDIGEYLLLSRTNGEICPILEGHVNAKIDAIEIGNTSFLIGGDGFITVLPAATVPCEDPDEDGINSSVDNCVDVANDGQEDGDGDGVGDACDNCPDTVNPGQADNGGLNTDAPDGIGDFCQRGDVDADGRVNIADDAVLRRSLADLPPGFQPAVPPNP